MLKSGIFIFVLSPCEGAPAALLHLDLSYNDYFSILHNNRPLTLM